MAKTRRSRSVLRLRWLAVGGLLLIGLLYVQPFRSYRETSAALDRRSAEVSALREERRLLERRLADSTSDAALLRQVRRLGFVKPGERLYIVKGIGAWRRAQGQRSTIERDG